MEEIKTNNVPPQEGQGGGRRRRRKKKRNNGNTQGVQQNNQPKAQDGQQNNQPKAQGVQQNNQPKGQNNQKQQNNQPKQKQGQPQQQKQPQPQQQKQQNTNQAQGKKQKNKSNGNNANKPQAKDENRKDTYLYALDGNLYVNLTNKCSNGCDFCVRNERNSYYGHYLWIRHGDPTVEKVIAEANRMDLSAYKEVVFCGFGEPTYKVNEMLALCDYFHSKGLSTRLNTNGQGNLINKRDITADFKDKLDMVNVSLNASCAEKYQPICRSQFGEGAFTAIVEFAKQCKRIGVNCRFSIVDCIGEAEVEACKRLAESVKIPLLVRAYITDSEE